VSWKHVAVQAHVHGPFKGPNAKGQVRIDGLNAGALQFRTFSADLEGNRGAVSVHAVLDRLHIPGRKPDLFQAAPIDLRADAKLDDPLRPVTFTLSHPLVSVRGNAKTAGELSAAFTVNGPALAPLAAVAGLDLKGHAMLDATVAIHNSATKVELKGIVAITGGAAPLPALIGDAAKLEASMSFQGTDLSVERAQLDGRTLRASGNGTAKNGIVDLNWKVALSDVAVVAPTVSGRIEAQGRIHGAPDNLDLVADATGEVGTAGFPRAPIRMSASLEGLPAAPAGRVEARGSIDGSPLELALAIQRARDGALLGTIERADWKSAHAEGSVSLRASDRLPQGRIAMRVAQLEDLQPWLGQKVQGSVVADVDLVQSGEHAQAKIQVDARSLVIGGTHVDRLSMTGRVDDPTTHPKAALQLAADGIAANGITGNARVQANGPQEALVLKVSSDLHNVGEADAQITTTATLNAPAKQVSFSALEAHYKGQTAQLLAPARVSFGDGLAVDRLRIGVQQAVLEASGRVAPTLELTASARNVTPELIKAFAMDIQADGVFSADARLSGTTAQPRGTVRVNATGLRTRSGAGRTLPASNLVATAELEDQSARIDVRLSGGSQMRFNASGRVPFAASGPIDVHASGTVDATIANPILEVNGRRVKGQITLDVAVTGTRAAPRIDGNAKLAQGDIQDYALGAHLSDVEAQLQAAGDTVRIVSFTAHAGTGTVSATGTVGALAPDRPVDVKLTARNAQPLATDLLTANMDLDLTVRGQASTRLDIAGKVTISHADINIPNALPPSVAVLDVRRPGQGAPPPPSAPALVVGLDLTVDAPRAVFVRGRGLEAELGGELRVGGTSTGPHISGGFDMRRGTFDLGGTSLTFTSGKVTFNGTGLRQKIDPLLDFEAESTSGGITAKLGVIGYADAPRITLTSQPDLPQDEILARLLFGTSVKQLSALQIAQIGGALVSLTGKGGGGINPLLEARKSLGLDRLSLGSTPTGGTSVEAGRYVSSRVYVGAKQSGSGSTQAKVEVDLTKNLKVQAIVGTGGTTAQGITPDNDPGSSIGLTYQFEY
jgi:translocation and assembly module TamB